MAWEEISEVVASYSDAAPVPACQEAAQSGKGVAAVERSQQGGDAGTGAGPAAADRKGLENMETTIFTKLCSAEAFGG